ncbi:hypothetical protein SLS62_004973 [Diatrype stigma]|uniref:Uncharacterized protein n=1 Tax=Diatrype stigma TaxID=117547 RepID=A0AAN9UPT8_9PEZI
MSSLLPQYNSPPHRNSYDHDLEELEPRPDDALLYTDYDSPKMPSRTHSTDSSMLNGSPRTPASASSKGRGKAVAIAYQGRPGSWRQQTRKSSFVPPIPPDITARRAPQYYPESVSDPAPEASFIETLLPRRTRPDELPTNSRVQVDDTFKEIARRERQMQKELQRLLDAQAAAVEQKLFGGQENDTKSVTGTPNTSRSQSASYISTSSRREKSSRQHVIPVRQPAERRLTLGQTRSRIIGVMRMLADLKAEEDACIATALAERKAGLSKLGSLKTRHQQIKHDIQEIEKDPSDPLTNDIRTIEGELQTVSGQIEEYRRLLRRAEQNKVDLERRLEEAKSEAASRLSGYKGALRECESGIRELVRRPNIRVLELAPSQSPTQDQGEHDTGNGNGADQQRQQQYITGFEFFRLRPERRTLPMARDWWEGEVAALEGRRTVVERERAALEEGEAIWAEVIDTIQRHEEQLTGALSGEGQPNNNNRSNNHDRNRSGSSSPLAQRDGSIGPVSSSSPIHSRASISADPRDVMRGQWDLLVAAIRKLERAHAYAEERGWTLLVAAIGAEISVYYDAREMLGDMLRSMGISPPPPPLEERSPDLEATQQSSAPLANHGAGANLVDMDVAEEQGKRGGSSGGGGGDALMHEELSASVIRRWENPDLDVRDDHGPQQPEDRQQQQQQQQRSENADPCADQFHPMLPARTPSPPGLSRQVGSELTCTVRHAVEGEMTDSEDDDNNEVPAGLLSEVLATRHSEDEQQKRHSNEIPPEFLSLHAGDNHAFPPAAAAARGGGEDLKESSGSVSGSGRRYRQSTTSTATTDANHIEHENQVPLDLLSERRPGLEDGDID